jgi:hypothetical protein
MLLPLSRRLRTIAPDYRFCIMVQVQRSCSQSALPRYAGTV